MTDASDASRDPRDQHLQRLAETLRRFAPPFARYVRGDWIGEGAMGFVHQANDQLLDRSVALKTLRTRKETLGDSERRLRRFLFEARVTGGLDHPAIVAVHDVGIDESGTPYFAMKLVRGEPLSKSFERLSSGEEAWTLPRLVAVLQRVCEAMGYAHQKGVLHRDLKPSNVMVGRFGEVYVMDWGLARTLDAPDENDIRVQPQAPATEQISADDSDSDLRTEDGDIVGTPAYMSPEQAHGRIAQMGPRSDIYSLGAMLYHLLAGHMPYVPRFSRAPAHTIFLWVREGPPSDLATIAPNAPPELVSVCNKAMAREPSQRFASMDEFADELRRYLEGRVVISHRTGPIIELRKWAGRNRVTAALAVATPLLLLGAGGMTLQAREHSLEEERFRNDLLAARELVASARQLGPLEPRSTPAMRTWLSAAATLLEREAAYLRDFRAITRPADTSFRPLKARPRGSDDDRVATLGAAFSTSSAGTRAELANANTPQAVSEFAEKLRVRALEAPFWKEQVARMLPRTDIANAAPSRETDRTRAEQLAELLEELAQLRRVERPQVEQDLELARSLHRRSIDAFADEWSACCRSVADPRECPRYTGIPPFVPQLGLEPLGLDPRTGLWEFWRLDSGERPTRDAAGEWRAGDTGGIVLVLLPGGPFAAGLPDGGDCSETWSTVLEPFFISKYELTQAQCMRLTGRQNSEHFAGMHYDGLPLITRAHPAESVSWHEGLNALRRVGLTLATEAQWEYAALAGQSNEHSTMTGQPSPTQLVQVANVADLDYLGYRQDEFANVVPAADGYALHAPVGSYLPNAFGLYDMHGNVAEWCLDIYVRPRERRPITVDIRTGERSTSWALHRTIKGGAFKHAGKELRITARLPRAPDARDDYIGARAVRAVDAQSQ